MSNLAKHFNIAISSVHNYKNRFKAEGLTFPTVRGKRPTGSVQIQSKTNVIKPVKEVSAQVKQNVSMEHNPMHIVVNGVSVQVSAEAKNVNITKDGIKVNF